MTFQTKRSLAYASLPFLSQELMKKLAHRKLVGVVILDNRAIIVNKRPRPTAKRKTLVKKVIPQVNLWRKNRVTFQVSTATPEKKVIPWIRLWRKIG